MLENVISVIQRLKKTHPIQHLWITFHYQLTFLSTIMDLKELNILRNCIRTTAREPRGIVSQIKEALVSVFLGRCRIGDFIPIL